LAALILTAGVTGDASFVFWQASFLSFAHLITFVHTTWSLPASSLISAAGFSARYERKMKFLLLFLLLFVAAAAPLAAQTANSSATPYSLATDLDRLQAAASQSALDIGHMRIDKWKTDGESKRQSQTNADSVQRNLTSALPELIQGVRTAPQDLNAQFKLYRNLNALYDVMASLTESTGAFGQKSDFQALGEQLQIIESIRRDLGDGLERLTSSTQNELNQLRTRVRTQQQPAAAATPPKKVVVDDTQPSKKATHKKKTAAKKPPADTTTNTSGDSDPKP
jgi:hypothetical protein